MITDKQRKKKSYWQHELESLDLEPKRKNELNDKEELESLAENIKQAYYQDYKTASSSSSNKDKEIDPKHFDYII